MLRVPRHPCEDLDRSAHGRGRTEQPRDAADGRRDSRYCDVRCYRGDEHRRDQLRPAAGMLFRRTLAAVLVSPDRDMLGPVIGGETRAAESERGRQERDRRGRGLLPAGREAGAAEAARDDRRHRDRAEHRRPLEREAHLRQPPPDERKQRECLGQSDRTAQEREARPRRRGEVRLAAGGHAELAVGISHGDRPRRRPVHEHAVLQRHPAEADRLVPYRVVRHRSDDSCELAQRLLEAICGRATLEPPAVELDERHHLAHGRRRERLVRTLELAEAEHALLDPVPA